jgi:energy-coupling factor transport system ATP-binding protein
METIKRLNREHGITMLLITHHMDEAAQARRVIVMKDGGIFMDGTPCEVFAEYEKLRAIDLTVPHTVELTHLAGLPPVFDVDECARAVFAWLKGEEPC